jgi:hypothetical protein
MKKKTNVRQKLLEEIGKAKTKGAEFVNYGGRDAVVRIDDAIDYISQLPEEPESADEEATRWYECDAAGNMIIRAREIFGGLTRHETGVIVWDGSADVFCGNWIETNGLPRSFGPPDGTGEGKKLVAVCMDLQTLDDDTLELAVKAALAKGDKTPSIHEAFRVNDQVTIITFNGWP